MAEIWDLLRNVTVVSFEARSAAQTGWNGAGTGSVAVSEPSPGVLVFAESGSWQPHGRRDIRFSNVYRWTLAGDVLRLEHLRFGEANAVHLIDFTQAGEREWRSSSPHLCRADCYSAVLTVRDDALLLNWTIDGPRKRETIEYVYL